MRAAYEASTILTFGARGVLDGAAFHLVGRTCVRGPKGGLWNEWVLRFDDDGSLKFLGESPSALTLFEEQSIIPALSTLTVGAPIDTGFIVVERGRATRVAHWGEVDGDAPSSYRMRISARAAA